MEQTKKLALGILAHVDAGKTTLAEGILYKTGQIRKAGRVDHKDAFLDTEELEKARGITIFSKQAELKMGNLGITLLDTPGHVDFNYEVSRSLAACFSICVVMVSCLSPAKSPDPPALQKIQPRFPRVPSRFGQVIPPFNEIRYTFSPKVSFR